MIKDIKKEKNGITLIALVITIIVLLILAGISISMVSSQDGILNKATQAKKVNEEATDEEKVKLAIQSALITGNGTLNEEAIEALNSELGLTGDKAIISLPAYVQYNGKYYSITSNGVVTGEPGVKEVEVTIYKNKEERTVKTVVGRNGSYEYDAELGEGIKLSDGYITGITVTRDSDNTVTAETVSEIKEDFPNGYIVCDQDGNEITDGSTSLASGMKVKNGTTEIGKIVVWGDVNEDGIITVADVIRMSDFIGQDIKNEVYKKIYMDIDHNGKVETNDAYYVLFMESGGKIIVQDAYVVGDDLLQVNFSQEVVQEFIKDLQKELANSYEIETEEDGETYYIIELNSEEELTTKEFLTKLGDKFDFQFTAYYYDENGNKKRKKNVTLNKIENDESYNVIIADGSYIVFTCDSGDTVQVTIVIDE